MKVDFYNKANIFYDFILESAHLFLKASGLEMIKNSIQSVFDEAGMKYETPIFCINDPQSYELKKVILAHLEFQKKNLEVCFIRKID